MKDCNTLHFNHTSFNIFSLAPALDFIKQYRKDGKLNTLWLNSDETAPVGLVHPDDVGHRAAILLSHDNHGAYNKARYVVNGSDDITGTQIVRLVEDIIGAKIESVKFRDTSVIDSWAAAVSENKGHILSIKNAPDTAREGKCSVSTTSKEIYTLAAPKITPAAWLKTAPE